MVLTRLRSRCWQRSFPSEDLENSSLAFFSSINYLHSLAHGHSTSTSASVVTFSSLTLAYLLLSFLLRTQGDIGLTQITQNNLPIKILNLITFPKSFMPCKITYSQVLGIRMQTSLVAHYSVYHGWILHLLPFTHIPANERRNKGNKKS